MREVFDIFDDKWNPTGEVADKDEAERMGKWHKVVTAWIINPRGELLLQLRGSYVNKNPNVYDVSVAGHIRAGETVRHGAVREIKEELGLDVNPDQLVEITTGNSKSSHLYTVFLVRMDVPLEAFRLDPVEVAGVKYLHWRELAAMTPEEMVKENIRPHIAHKALFEHLEKTEKL